MNKFSKDLYRYYGEKGESFTRRLFRPTELKYIALFRKAENCKFKPLKLYYTIKLKLKSYKTHIQIPARTKIGEGFCMIHPYNITVSSFAILGKNVNMYKDSTIGNNTGNPKGAPVIGDCVQIGINSTVIGGITVGDDVVIAPNTFVNFDKGKMIFLRN